MDGGQRNRLIREAIAHIESFSVTGEMHREATDFPTALAEIPYFDRVVTTNWDPFLEQSLGVLVPMVEDRDLAFWDDNRRQVLKIHGCITRPYTLVATRNDYETCMKQSPLIFNKLRDLMATKTFIFVGYSMRDSDFLLILDEIIDALGTIRKLAYSLDPEPTAEKARRGKARRIQVIKATGLAFLTELRRRLEEQDLIPRREFLGFLSSERRRIVGLHLRMNQGENGGIASAMYQDGLLHALEDVLAHTSLGKKAEDFHKYLRECETDLRNMVQEKDIIEIAYLSGWREVFGRFCERTKTPIPPYFHPRKLTPISRYIKG